MFTLRRSFVTPIVVLAIVGAVSAAPLTASAAGIEDGAIIGSVVDGVTGTPVEGIVVTARALDNGAFELTDTTDADGDYGLFGLQRDHYILSFTSPDDSYAPRVWEAAQTEEDATLLSIYPDEVFPDGLGESHLFWNLRGLALTPRVTGTVSLDDTEAVVGNTITAVTDSPAAASAVVNWFRDGEVIQEQASASHLISADDAGARLSARVVLRAPGYSTVTLRTDETDVVEWGPSAASIPSITGTTRVGSVLSAESLLWKSSLTNPTFQWYRETTPITGATGASYRLTNAEAGFRLSVTVRGTGISGANASVMSSDTDIVTGGQFTAGTFSIAGTTAVGMTVTARAAFSPRPAGIVYQWFRNGVPIRGATSAARTLTADDADAALSVSALASRSYFDSATSMLAVKSIDRRLDTTPRPTISGTPRAGRTLHAAAGTWTPAPVKLAYRWYRGSTPISGATSTTYLLRSNDRGAKITVQVMGSRTGYLTVAQKSASVTVK